ncbi:MAG: alpha/beta hydrolase [Planctomycetota bacterium]
MPASPGLRRRIVRKVLDYILLLSLVYVALCAVVFFVQRRLLYFPRAEHVATPADVGLDHRDVWLEPEPGQRVHAWLVPCERARAVVLFMHGNAGNVSDRLATLALLHELGLATLIPDYPGYGRSAGSPSEASILATGRAALRWLREADAVPSRRVVLWGRSLGGAVAACLAPEAEAAGLIVESSFPSVGDMARHLYPWLPTGVLLLDRFEAAESLRALPVPKLFLHSRQDETVPFELGRRLHASAADPKRFVELSGTHDDGFLQSGEVYRDAVSGFLDDLLGASPAGAGSAGTAPSTPAEPTSVPGSRR